MRSIIYLRTSTREQTPELQLRDIQTLCPPENSITFKEKQSAWKENVKRPVFESIVEQIKAGKIDHIYAWDWDRIYRNRVRLKEFLLLCKIRGVVLHTYRQKWFEDFHNIPKPFDEIVMDLITNILGWLGEEESIKRSSRIKMAVTKTAEGTFSHEGKKWGRKSFPKQTVKRVLELARAGKSVRAIAKEVQVYDANKNGRAISKSAVHKILTENSRKKGS
jgi:DNA invertase Pin-like site-specific DNA recombinase